MKLAVTLRHLSIEESYTLLQYHWRIEITTICKFFPQVCKAILKEFQQEYLIYSTDPEDWKKIEERFRNRWNVSHAVSALDGKRIAIKKPKKSGSEYFNYKGYISLVLLALVAAEHKFLWVNVGASGSSSDAQIFNCNTLKRRIENRTLRLPPPELLGPGRPYLHYFMLGDNTFALFPCTYALAGQAIQQTTTGQRGENGQLQDIQGHEGGWEFIWNSGWKVQGAADHHGAEAKSCERHCVKICGTT